MKDENRPDLLQRTKSFAVRIVRMYVSMPKSVEAQVLGKQVLRSGTSIGAQYHEAQRAKSDADFISKLEGALQELDETCYWLELIVEVGIFGEGKIEPLREEAEELIKIMVTIVKQVKERARKK